MLNLIITQITGGDGSADIQGFIVEPLYLGNDKIAQETNAIKRAEFNSLHLDTYELHQIKGEK